MKRLLLTFLFTAYALCASAQGYKVPEIKISGTVVSSDGEQWFSHMVSEKETLYSICRAYGVTTEDIYMSNPGLHLEESVLHIGDILLIPWTQTAEDKLQAQILKRRSDSLALILHHADSSGVLTGGALLTDTQEENGSTSPDPAGSLGTETPDSIAVELPYEYIMTDTVKLAMFLPLNADVKPNERYLSFYMGALIAIRELGRSGVNIQFSTIDSNSAEFGNAPAIMEQSDVVIGPVSYRDVVGILPSVPEGKYIVSPLDTKTEDLALTGRIILASTPTSVQIRDAAAWIREDYNPGDSLCIVEETGVQRSAAQQGFVEQILQVPGIFHINYEPRAEAVKDAKSDKIVDVFTAHTHEPEINRTIFLIVSEHDFFISDAIRMIDVQTYRKRNVALYGPAKMRMGDMENLCDANLHASVTFHIDYTDPDVIAFILAYRALYNTDPDSFAFHGYDTAKYFIKACSKYGKQWHKKLPEFRMEGLQTGFSFTQPEGAGYVNQAIRRVVYSPGFKQETIR